MEAGKETRAMPREVRVANLEAVTETNPLARVRLEVRAVNPMVSPAATMAGEARAIARVAATITGAATVAVQEAEIILAAATMAAVVTPAITAHRQVRPEAMAGGAAARNFGDMQASAADTSTLQAMDTMPFRHTILDCRGEKGLFYLWNSGGIEFPIPITTACPPLRPGAAMSSSITAWPWSQTTQV